MQIAVGVGFSLCPSGIHRVGRPRQDGRGARPFHDDRMRRLLHRNTTPLGQAPLAWPQGGTAATREKAVGAASENRGSLRNRPPLKPLRHKGFQDLELANGSPGGAAKTVLAKFRKVGGLI